MMMMNEDLFCATCGQELVGNAQSPDESLCCDCYKYNNRYMETESNDKETEYKFVLLGPDNEWVCDLATKFVPSEDGYSTDMADADSGFEACTEALTSLNYTVKVVNKNWVEDDE
jgi:hypothetical protein